MYRFYSDAVFLLFRPRLRFRITQMLRCIHAALFSSNESCPDTFSELFSVSFHKRRTHSPPTGETRSTYREIESDFRPSFVRFQNELRF